MNANDEVIYTIIITGIKTLSNQSELTKALPAHIGTGNMRITPATKTSPGAIDVPRLYTRWRGDASELVWQKALTDAIKDMGQISIEVTPWTYAPGYPQGDID